MVQQQSVLEPTASTVKCDVCLKEIPESGAKNAETSDYVRHFCGLECYQKWENQKKLIEKS
ncbi:MAG: DUF3330 domain-containing protein [Pseudomonadota bacterium]